MEPSATDSSVPSEPSTVIARCEVDPRRERGVDGDGGTAGRVHRRGEPVFRGAGVQCTVAIGSLGQCDVEVGGRVGKLAERPP